MEAKIIAQLIMATGLQDVNQIEVQAVAKALLDSEKVSEWISVEDRLPDPDEKVWFWLIPKSSEECPHDTSGKPIVSNAEPFMDICKWKCWGSLSKPTYWMPLPEPPKVIAHTQEINR